MSCFWNVKLTKLKETHRVQETARVQTHLPAVAVSFLSPSEVLDLKIICLLMGERTKRMEEV